VIGYSAVVGAIGPLGRKLIYVIPERHPNDQALIDLAVDLRAKYPSAYFDIVDSTSSAKRIAAYDAKLSGNETLSDQFVKNEEQFSQEHEFAMLNKFLDPAAPNGPWKLVKGSRTIAAFQN
jgi:hypothetical protein